MYAECLLRNNANHFSVAEVRDEVVIYSRADEGRVYEIE